MRIASATGAHIPAIAALMAASPLLRRYRVTVRSARVSVTDALRAGDEFRVAVDGDAVVGFAWSIRTRALDRAAYLRLLLVAEDRRSRGIGAALLARVERDARAAGSRHMVLLVTATNRRARAFYARHGYRHVAHLPGFVQPGVAESLYVKKWPAPRHRK
ncbi:MAG TPA: GNAT family N-acetyltransferase [Candidatus Limnocylindria bacterium]|nr:GNAT family N-acetyltransferase [Candidatus Limnocylindria bacterium]